MLKALVLIALTTRVGGVGPVARVPAFSFTAPTGGARAPGAAMCAPGPRPAPPESERRTLPGCAQQRATTGTRCGVLALRAAEGVGWGWRQDTVERGGASSCARSRRAHAHPDDAVRLAASTGTVTRAHAGRHGYQHACDV